MQQAEQTIFLGEGSTVLLVKDEVKAKVQFVYKPMSREQLADYYGVKIRTIDSWRRKKLITHEKINGIVRFDLATVRQDLARFKIFPKKKPT